MTGPTTVGALDGATYPGACPFCLAAVTYRHVDQTVRIRHESWCRVLTGDEDARLECDRSTLAVIAAHVDQVVVMDRRLSPPIRPQDGHDSPGGTE